MSEGWVEGVDVEDSSRYEKGDDLRIRWVFPFLIIIAGS
jgi:hypothetical protein